MQQIFSAVLLLAVACIQANHDCEDIIVHSSDGVDTEYELMHHNSRWTIATVEICASACAYSRTDTPDQGVYCFPTSGSQMDTCCGTKFEKPKNNTKLPPTITLPIGKENSTTNATQPISPEVSSDVYSGCSTLKTCFGSPAGCEKTKNCDYMVTWKMKTNTIPRLTKVSWETIREGSGYVAVGISKDAGMGDKEGQGDIMFICNQTGVHQRTSKTANVMPILDSGAYANLTLTNKSMIDNKLMCKFESSAVLREGFATGMDLGRESFFVLMAKGEMDKENIAYHGKENKMATKQPVNFSKPIDISNANSTTKPENAVNGSNSSQPLNGKGCPELTLKDDLSVHTVSENCRGNQNNQIKGLPDKTECSVECQAVQGATVGPDDTIGNVKINEDTVSRKFTCQCENGLCDWSDRDKLESCGTTFTMV